MGEARQPPHDAFRFDGDEVHVWTAALDQLPEVLEALRQTLAPEERQRADRFYFPRDRDHFTAGRGFLRALLAGYLGTEPGHVQLSYIGNGKPTLPPDAGDASLRFNLSHSHGLAVYAFARGRELGVDVEKIRADLEIGPIADRFFSPREAAALRALPADLHPEAFFTCWTRKEAYVKARGQGLSFPLDRFDVSLVPGEPARLLAVLDEPEEVSRWSVNHLAPPGGFVAALVAEGHGLRVTLRPWPASS